MRGRPFLLLPLVLTAAACASRAHSTEAAPPMASSTEPREQTADQQVLHALGRLGFGPRPGDVQRVRQMGVDAWVARQLHPERIDDRATDAVLAHYELIDRSAGELARDYPPPALVRMQLRQARGDSTVTAEDSARLREAQRQANRIVAELQSARVARAVTSERQLQEVMTDFWENHFNVYLAKGPAMRYYVVDYDRDVIRPRALGKFRDLLGAVAKSEAMLTYLDNAQSVADSGRPTAASYAAARGRRARRGVFQDRLGGNAARVPGPGTRRRGVNENYARELMELHTLGVDGGYTQQDVQEVARAFTGWSIVPPRQGSGFAFRPAQHDAGAKRVLGRALPAGRGIEDGEEVLDILARSPATARFLATKLARRFVSDSPPPALVARLADRFTRTDGDIRATLETLFASPEFWSRAAYRAKVKSPFETVVSALRALGAPADTTPRTALVIARLGEPLWGHQAPNGWPETGDAWMNTGAILQRINFGLAVAAGRLPGAGAASWPEAARLTSAPRAEQVDGVVAALLGGDASPETREILLTGTHPMLGGRAAAAADTLPDEGGAMAMDDGRAMADAARGGGRAARGDGRGADRMLARLPELRGLDQVVGLALGSPEFQRR